MNQLSKISTKSEYDEANDRYKIETGGTILIRACREVNVELVHRFLELGADPHEWTADNWQDTDFPVNALWYVLEIPGVDNLELADRQYACLRLLIEYGADVNCRYLYGFTPLMYACAGNSKRMYDILIEAGADNSRCHFE